MEIFEERLHPISVTFFFFFTILSQRDALPPEVITKDPDHRQIYRFVKTLFYSAQLTAECAIITLVSIFHLVAYNLIFLWSIRINIPYHLFYGGIRSLICSSIP